MTTDFQAVKSEIGSRDDVRDSASVIRRQLWLKYQAKTEKLREYGSHLPHCFQNLRSFLGTPHAAYRPLIICDTDHDRAATHDFLLGPFFNVAILGLTRDIVLHEITTEAAHHFSILAEAVATEKETDARMGFLTFLDLNGYRNIGHEDQAIYRGLADSVTAGARGGVRILPGDVRKMEETDKVAAVLQDEIDRRFETMGPKLFTMQYYRDLHKKVFGFDFPYGREALHDVVRAIALEDIDAVRYRGSDEPMADYAFAQAKGKSFAMVVGADHASDRTAERVRKLTGYDPVTLEISFWGGATNMLRNIYRGQKPNLVYVIRSDKIIHRPEELPALNPEKIAEFKRCILESAAARPLPQVSMKPASPDTPSIHTKAGAPHPIAAIG